MNGALVATSLLGEIEEQYPECRAVELSIQLESLTNGNHPYLNMFLLAQPADLYGQLRVLWRMFGDGSEIPEETELTNEQSRLLMTNFCTALEKEILIH